MNKPDPSNSPWAVTSDERRRLVRLAYRFCWNEQDAEDAVQDALLSSVAKFQQLHDQAKHWAWLCRIVVQQCHLLGRQRLRRRERREQTSAASEPTVHGGVFDSQELGEIMRRLLVELPEQQRTAVTLRHIEQMDYPEIARIMEVAESTVRVHVRAGREALRGLILARHPEWKP